MKALMKSFALLILVLAAASAGAQSFTGTVSGTVTDEQGGALPGVTVTLHGKTGARTTVTDAKGEYRFTAVDPGTYDLSAELTGFRSMKRAEVPVSIGKTAEGLFTMKVGGMGESVDVLGESPLVDVTSSATDNSLSQDILFNFPIRYGNVATALLNSLPGINAQSAYGGDASSGNALLIDGVDTRDPSGGTAWTFYNFNIVEEVQAVGIGAPAEFGAFSGAVINTVTKSGGNRYSGLFDVTYTNDSLAGDNISDAVKRQNATLSDPAKTNQLLDITTQLSGPIIKDKLFFFMSAQRYHLKQDPSGPATLRDEVSPRFNGKLTWQPIVQRHRQRERAVRLLQHHRPLRGGCRPVHRRPHEPGGRSRVGVAHVLAPPVRVQDLHRDQVHRLVGLLRPDAQDQGAAAQRRRHQPDLGLPGLGVRRRPRPPPGERVRHALRRRLGQARPEVRRRDRAQQDARPLSVLQQHLLLRLRRLSPTTRTATATTSTAATGASRCSCRTPGSRATG